METKNFYRSKEVWVLGIAIAIGLAEYLGVDFEGMIGDATAVWQAIAIPAALVLRLFFTEGKVTI